MLACGVVGAAGVEVVVGGESAETEDGFGSFEAPAGSRDAETVAENK